MMKFRISPLLVLFALLAVAVPVSVQAQIQPPAGPVTFCFVQAPPAPTSYETVVDGGSAEPMTPATPAATACPATATHSFTLPAAPFTIGTHSVMVRTVNTFGTTNGPAYTVVVGIAPGAATIIAVIPPGE